MTDIFLDGNAAGGGNGSQGSPYNSVTSVPNTSGVLANASTTLYFRGGTTVPMDIGAGLRPPAGGTLLVRPYDGGALPVIASVKKGFLSNGVGSLLDVRQVKLTQDAASATGIQAIDGGSLTLQLVTMTGWYNAVKCGTGTLLVEDNDISAFAWNGISCDAVYDAAIAVNAIFRRNLITARSTGAAGQDPFVLHDGGIGLGTGYLVEDNVIQASNPQSESGMVDEQQQYRGVIVRGNTGYGATQWGYAQGSLIKNTAHYTFATKSAMLDFYSREGLVGKPLLADNSNLINCGHIAIVTSDGANNGIYQLTGNDPTTSGAWAGPMTADDLLAVKSLIYENTVSGHGGGVQIQHPGTQFVSNAVLGITGAYGAALKLYSMGYGVKAWDNDFELATGAATARGIVRVDPLLAQIATRQRLVLRNTKVRADTTHTGPFFDLGSANDAGQIDSDYCGYIRPALSNAFALVAGVSKTFAEFKALNGSSDAHSQNITTAAALIDADGRLLDGSPLIGAGVARSGLDPSIPATDVDGNALSSPPDIGAYRYLSEAQQAAVRPTTRRLFRTQRVAGTAPDVNPPGPVTGLTPGISTTTTIAFAWAAAARATSYELRHAVTGSGPSWSGETHLSTGTTGEVTGLVSGTSYDVQIRAWNGAGSSDWSATVVAATA